MSLTLDLIQTEVQNKKLIGVKVTYIHHGAMVSWNLAVRAYNPTAKQMEGEKKASELLMDWCKLILQEYNIHPEKHILTSCSDSGSDVKRALEVVFPTHREWCVSHLTHLALADAFGSSVDPSKTKNADIRRVLNDCRKVIETVNKSKVLKAKFDEKQKNDLGKELKLKNTPSHCWSATEDVLIKLLRCWNPLRHAFLETNHLF